MTPARIVRGARGLVLAGVITVAAPAAAQAPGAPVDAGEGDTGDAEAGDARDDKLAPDQVITGIAEPEERPGDTARAIGDAILFVPRTVIDYTFAGVSTAARLVADDQLVPRYRQLIGAPPGGDIFVFPTLFAETGTPLNVGARFLANTDLITTSQRVGYGGADDWVVDTRVLIKGSEALPIAVSFETFYEEVGEEEYHGVGITPRLDPRNSYRGQAGIGLYQERRTRGVVSLGIRPLENLELFLAGSLSRRQVDDSEDVGGDALSQVFDVGTIPGATTSSWIGYMEAAARFDSRLTRGKPAAGVLLEAYGGTAKSVLTSQEEVAFMRIGWRVAGGIPIYRATNILIPKLVFDRLVPLGDYDVPFNELPRQPDFRGFDTRRDELSVVGALDYTWRLVPFMGLRVFLDAATVAPGLTEFSLEQIENLRYAGGVGVDFYTENALLAQLAIATSPEGVRLLIDVGSQEGFGDRVHRE